MSNTSLKPITIPKLNTPNFGQAIKDAFADIELNFQKLSNLGVNQGAPGRSCVYIPINLGAAFIYNPYAKTDNAYFETYTHFLDWEKNQLTKLKDDEAWNDYVATVQRDYEQFHNITGYDEHEYARIACILLWGNPSPFGISATDKTKRVTPTPTSLTGALHERYMRLEGPAQIKDADGQTLYGNWLYELYRLPENALDAYYDMFITHWRISSVGKLIVAFSPDSEQGALQPVGSFEYWYIDPRYRCGKEVVSDDAISDISCVLRWESDNFVPGPETRWNGSFRILEIFPTIRVGSDGRYYWYINGLNTGVPVQGEPGKDGRPGQMIVVERIENVTGWSPKFPNGKDFASPKGGEQTIMVPTYSGVPSRVRSEFLKQLDDNVEIAKSRVSNVETTFTKQYTFAGVNDKTGRISQFSFNETNPWLSDRNTEYSNFDDIAYLFRIFRIVGREKFWTYDFEDHDGCHGIVPINEDEWNRAGDPSCDEFYFGSNGFSHIDKNAAIQTLIKELDGTLAIVLPGPAYQHDRTDTSFWFASLRVVKTDDPEIFELVAYCSPHAQYNTQLDEHSQAGMMMGFDAYTHKSTSDNRNKPRGLILPIGSIEAATDTPSDTWAAHIMHSDTAGFETRQECGDNDYRGIQKINDENRIYDNGTPRQPGTNPNIGNNQFSEVIGKRILHIGSVLDIRALNYTEDLNNNGALNGAVPGRAKRDDEGSLSEVGSDKYTKAIGSANFFGKLLNTGWFEGSELHVDEPVTITRYRDLKPKGRLLDIEGDTVIGPHTHKNFPGIKYRYRSGGLWVGSTLTEETTSDTKLFEKSIFTKPFIEGTVALKFEPFVRPVARLTTDNDKDDPTRWRSKLGRWKGRRAIYKNEQTVLKGLEPYDVFDNPLFSAVFDDTVGARMLIAEDGFAIYNPDFTPATVNGEAIHIPFSVDAFGNIQTYGREVRSNSFDTAWWFHTKWTMGGKTEWSNFRFPAHNELLFGSDHEIQYGTTEDEIRSWKMNDLGKMSTDPCKRPLGYYQTFGFADKNSSSGTTFPQHNAINSSRAWGATDYLPTVISLPTDFLWVWGGQLTEGVNPYAFAHTFDGNTYGMRYGSTVQFGLFIPKAARKPIANDAITSTTLTQAKYRAEDLVVKFNGTTELKDTYKEPNYNGTTTEHNDTFGFTNMFELVESECPVGLWIGQGAVIEKAMIVGGDIVGHKALSVRGQARAKSFRRHTNALNDGSEWAFMLDDGKSSIEAPELMWDKGEPIPVQFDQYSPLNIDMGEFFGSHRIAKFGYTSKLSYNQYTKKIGHTNDFQDREISLLSVMPFSNIRRRSNGHIFSGDNRYLAYSAELTCLFNICTLQVTINVDKMCASYDTWHGGWLHVGNKRRQYAYGISMADFAKKDEGPYWVAGGKSAPVAGYKHPNTKPIIKFDGFKVTDLFGNGLEYLKPTTKVWQFIGSTHGGGDSCAWYDNRDYQYGMWVCLNESGQLESTVYNGNGALFDIPTKITLTFVWIPSLKGSKKYVYAGYSSAENVTPVNWNRYEDDPEDKANHKTAEEKAEEYFETIREKWDTQGASYNGPEYYLWKKVEINDDANITPGDWVIEDIFEWENITYHTSKEKQETNVIDKDSGDVIDIQLSPKDTPINITTTYKSEIEKVGVFGSPYSTEEDVYRALTSMVTRFLWSKTESRTGNANMVTTWELIYEWTIDSNTGLFAQNTKEGLVGFAETQKADWISDLYNYKFGHFSGDIKVPDGIFKKMGAFSGTNIGFNDDGYVNKIAISRYTSKSFIPGPNSFSVQYWEEGKTSFLRLNIACDAHWKPRDHMYAAVWGIYIKGEDGFQYNRTYKNIPTKAYLPVGAKLPSHAIYARLSGAGSAYSTWRDNRSVYGGGQFMLDKNGQIYIEHINNPRVLVSCTEPHSYIPVVSILFTYPSSSDKMEKNYYDEMTDIGEVPEVTPTPSIPTPEPEPSDDNSSEDNLTWSSNSDPTTASLLTWLNNSDRANLKSSIISVFDGDLGDKDTISSPYGQATIENTASGVKVSLWVTSASVDGLTHRSINFTTTKSGTEENPVLNITGLHTVLLEKNFNPGYYKSTGKTGNTPNDPVYIGTTQTESSTDVYPYIWYTNDGKTWKLVDAPIELDPDYYYVLATLNGFTRDNPGVNNSPERHIPCGITATFNADGTVNVFNGKSNYMPVVSGIATSLWPRSGENDTNVIVNKFSTAAPGVLKKLNGFGYCFKIHKNNWSQRTNGRYWSTVDVVGIANSTSWDDLSEIECSSIRNSWKTWWVNDDGSYAGRGDNAEINISKLKTGSSVELNNWISTVFMMYLIGGSQWYDNWKSRKYSLYSNETGFGGQWQQLVIKQDAGLIRVHMGTEQTLNPPTTDSGAGVGTSLHCTFYVDIQYNQVSIRGGFECDFIGFDRSVPGKPKRLCAAFGLGQGDQYWPTGLSEDNRDRFSLPVVDNVLSRLMMFYDNKLYSIEVRTGTQGDKCIVEEISAGGSGTPGPTGKTPVISMTAKTDNTSLDNPTVEVTKSGTTDEPSFELSFKGLKGKPGEGGTVDTTALENRIAALENMVRMLATTPEIVTLNVPAGQSSIEVEINEYKPDGTEVNVDELDIKTESGITHNG